jgi:intein/homing endonuclease
MVDECFAGSSKVLTPDGYVAIKDIKAGDKVINYSEDTKEFKIDTVIKQHKNLTNSASEKMYELEFDNGSKIQVTGNHKFLTTNGWIRADQLKENHEIINTNISTYS